MERRLSMKHGWEYKKLGDFITEYSVKNKGNETIPVYSVTNSQGFCKEYFSKEVASQDKSTYKIVPYGCFAYNPSRINVGSIDWQDKEERVIVSPLYNVFSVSEKLNQDYLLYFIKSKGTMELINAQATGTVRLNLKLSMLKEFQIPIPSLHQQQSIVSELDKINELIRLKKEQLSDYDKLAKSLFYEMFGDPVENEKGWEVKKLGEEYKVSSSKRIMQDEWTTEGVPFLKVSDVVSKINGQNSEPSTFISETTYSKLVDSNAVPVQNDILITSRGTLGLCYIVKNEDRFYFQDGMITWLAECKGNITPLFLTYLFKNHHFLQQITSKANKSTVAYISISQISKRKIPLPPLALQNLFAQRIELIEQQKAEIKSTIADLETLLASRMQYWFFGF